MIRHTLKLLLLGISCGLLSHCGPGAMGTGNMGGPTMQDRSTKIANEPTGDFFYGRRYYVRKTRFWGYVRNPRQPWSRAKLVLMREDKVKAPDRLSEDGASGHRYGYDNNYEYRLRGYYTGNNAYDPNSNQFLPEFMLTGYDVVNRQPGWLFRPDDRYSDVRITLTPR